MESIRISISNKVFYFLVSESFFLEENQKVWIIFVMIIVRKFVFGWLKD